MSRPSQQEVAYALEWFAQSKGGPGGVLASEVRELTAERDALKAKVDADADVLAVCERLLTENRSEVELLAEIERLRAMSLDACEYETREENETLKTQLRVLRESLETLCRGWDSEAAMTFSSGAYAGAAKDLRALLEKTPHG